MGEKRDYRRCRGVVMAAVSGAVPASAKPLEHGDFHDEFSGRCWKSAIALTVQVNGVLDGAPSTRRGRDDLVYFKERATCAFQSCTRTWTTASSSPPPSAR